MEATQLQRGLFQWEEFKAVNKKTYVQYDYRDMDGELYSVVKPTLEECRIARDEWLIMKSQKKG